MPETLSSEPGIVCSDCGSAIAPALVACPRCHRLVHASRLAALMRDAEVAGAASDHGAVLEALRQALPLLPPRSRQHETLAARVAALEAEQSPVGQKKRDAPRTGGALSWVGVSAAAAFLLTKGKFLVLGLTKSTTLLSMLAAVGVYWTQWGMLFAIGFVLSIYVHEMGHVAALHRYGVPASPPMFVPGLGAFVRMRHMPASAAQNARIGLAGPVWGLGAAIAAMAAFIVTGNELWAAIARTGAWLNLFNLLPIWQLDGGRAFVALSTTQRWLATLAVGMAWQFSGEGLLVLLVIASLARAALDRTAPVEGDRGALALFVALIGMLTYLLVITASVSRSL